MLDQDSAEGYRDAHVAAYAASQAGTGGMVRQPWRVLVPMPPPPILVALLGTLSVALYKHITAHNAQFLPSPTPLPKPLPTPSFPRRFLRLSTRVSRTMPLFSLF